MLFPHIGDLRRQVCCQKGQGLLFGHRHGHLTVADALCEPGTAVLPGIPLVHPFEDVRGLMNGQHRTLGDDHQLPVRDDRGNLDDRIPLGIETGHFQIDPDEPVCLRTHARHS